jgi:dihydroorotase/N-acyl-D-amino-acid deacylase
MRLLLYSLVLAVLPHILLAQTPQFDILIRNGHIIDGTGSPWYAGDVAIRDGRIAAVGRLVDAIAKDTFDAGGMVVAPGFIDMLGQSDLSILVDPRVPSKIFQGITTEITGEGSSAAPLNDEIIASDKASYDHLQVTPDWRTWRQYFARLERQGIGINFASYVGATQVRRMVLGDSNRTPTGAQLDSMKALVRQAMQEGAVGLSTALQYPPAPYARTEELIALASEASRFGGVYATHLRSEGDAIIPALDEAIRIGREARIPVEVWHLKASASATGGECRRLWRKSRLRATQGLTSPPIPTPTLHGSTRCRPLRPHGPTTAALSNWSSGCATPLPANASAPTC